MIRACGRGEVEEVLSVINDGARRYRGQVSPRHLSDPYMARDELLREWAAGVAFWGYEEAGALLGVMGLQPRGEVALVRHAYVREDHQGRGIGTRLLDHVRRQTEAPLLVGTWAEAKGALRFYQGQGFRLLPRSESERLLRRYWDIPEPQIRASVVLAGPAWFREEAGGGPSPTP